jgi:hypothetical protein
LEFGAGLQSSRSKNIYYWIAFPPSAVTVFGRCPLSRTREFTRNQTLWALLKIRNFCGCFETPFESSLVQYTPGATFWGSGSSAGPRRLQSSRYVANASFGRCKHSPPPSISHLPSWLQCRGVSLQVCNTALRNSAADLFDPRVRIFLRERGRSCQLAADAERFYGL